jgi:Spy/CpxP family protein refolding chaperone
MTVSFLRALVASTLLSLPAANAADEAAKPSPTAPRAAAPADTIGGKLIPPELIISHQAELRIDDRQREAILKEVEHAQAQFPRLQWQLQAATEQLSQLLDAPQVDETKALAQASDLMRVETEIKRMHLALLIRIRNILTDTQRAKAQEIRRALP